MAKQPPPILEMRNIVKEFPGVRALDNVTMTVQTGDIHSICGENGAGKSTLMRSFREFILLEHMKETSTSTASR